MLDYLSFVIGNAVDFGALSREFLSKPKSNLASAVPDIDTTDLIVCSFTRIHVQIRWVTFFVFHPCYRSFFFTCN